MNLLVRPARTDERNYILRRWKLDLRDSSPPWGKSMQGPEWWALVNYVLNVITYDSCIVSVVCHAEEPDFPIAFFAKRGNKTLHVHATSELLRHPEIAARVHTIIAADHDVDLLNPDFNPFQEMNHVQGTL